MRLTYFSLILLLICSCTNPNTNRSKLIHFVPENATVILKTSNLESLKSSIQNSGFLQKLSKTNSYKTIEDKLESLSILNPIDETLICFSKDKTDSLQYSIISKYHKDLFKTDSLPNYIEETFTYKNKPITKSNLNNNTFYSTIIDSVFIASSSKEIIEASFNKPENNFELEKIYNTTGNDKTLSIITNLNNAFISSFFIEDSLSLNTLTNHIAVDVDINQNEIIINGITKATDSSKSLINIFKNSIPQENQIQNITPSNSDGFLSFTFDDFHDFEGNLAKFNKKDSLSNTTLFDNIIEVGVIYESKNKAIILNSLDVIATKDALVSELNIIDTYRQIDVYDFDKPSLFIETFSPLITFNKATKYCVLDNFFVFADNMEMLQNIIANYQNKTTLSEKQYFKNIKENLSDESSLLMVVNTSTLKNILNKNLQENSTLKLEKYNKSASSFMFNSSEIEF